MKRAAPSLLDRVVAYLSPRAGYLRTVHRAALERLYDAAITTPQRRIPTDRRSGDGVMEHANWRPVAWARHLDQNVDLVSGLLDALSSQAAAVTIEPQVKRADGNLHDEANDALSLAWERQRDLLEVSGTMSWAELRLSLARSWLRDGEVLTHHLERAPVVGRYASPLPYQVQALEGDYLPWELTDASRNLVHGIERDGLGRVLRYHLYAEHPGNSVVGAAMLQLNDYVAIPADRLSHLRRTNRLGQARGISVLAPVITRIDDLRDYEESERIAARLAASLCAFITRDAAATPKTDVDTTTGERKWKMQAGVIFDQMLPGEGVEFIDAKRPAAQVSDWRRTQVRALSAGTGANASTTGRDYEGSYSSQRQELVEHLFGVRHRLQAPFIAGELRPIWRRLVRTAVLEGQVPLAGVDPDTLADANYNTQSVPWIDMLNEIKAEAEAIRIGVKSRHQVIREHDGDPRRVDAELERDDFTTATPTPAAPPADGAATEGQTNDAIAA